MKATSAGQRVRPRVSWHRGGAELAPFASLAAFAQAASKGAELVEVDLRQSADGALVCLHDSELPGLGPLEALSWEAVGDRPAVRARAFGLETLLDTLDRHDPERRTAVHLDLKATGYEAEAVGAILARSRTVVVTTLERASISTVRRSFPHVEALLTLGRDGRGRPLRDRVALRRHELVPFSDLEGCGATGVAVHYLLATPVLRRFCTRRGLSFLVWTVDGDDALQRWLARHDVDVVTTNRPLAALSIRQALEAASPG